MDLFFFCIGQFIFWYQFCRCALYIMTCVHTLFQNFLKFENMKLKESTCKITLTDSYMYVLHCHWYRIQNFSVELYPTVLCFCCCHDTCQFWLICTTACVSMLQQICWFTTTFQICQLLHVSFFFSLPWALPLGWPFICCLFPLIRR
jgi:hypothetical protein